MYKFFMSRETLLLVFLALVAISCLAQAIAIFVMARVFNRQVDALLGRLERLTSKAARSMEQLGSGIANVESGARQAALTVNNQIDRLFPALRQRTEKTGSQIEDSLQAIQARLTSADARLSRMLVRLQSATATAQRIAMGPTGQIHPVASAVRSALGHYFTKKLRRL